MSDEAVAAKTGRKWGEWFRILDKAGARKMAHREIAKLLHAKHKVPGWWCQMVTVEYEQARGMRALHQKATGFEAGVSRTFEASVGALYQAWTDAGVRRRWLGAAQFTVTTDNPNKNLSMVWGKGPERVGVYFYSKGAGRAAMTVQHHKLPAAKDVAARKKFWRTAMERLAKAVRG
jgi:hypothetical protein